MPKYDVYASDSGFQFEVEAGNEREAEKKALARLNEKDGPIWSPMQIAVYEKPTKNPSGISYSADLTDYDVIDALSAMGASYDRLGQVHFESPDHARKVGRRLAKMRSKEAKTLAWQIDPLLANPAEPSSEDNPPADFDDAYAGYERFQDLTPKKVGTFGGMQIPARLQYAGEGINILYRSGKWGDGEHNYIHEHEAGVTYAIASRNGGDGESVEVPSFIREAKTLYLLGDFQGFKSTEMEAKVRKPYPKLYAVPSGKALLVVEEDGRPRIAAIIWGGHLDVRAEGIVG